MSSRKNIPQIIAMKHLPSNPCTLEALSKNSLFITDDFDVEELKEIQNNPKVAQIIAVFMGQLAEQIFRGVYEPTKNNPIYPMQVFLVFHAQGLYPPTWVLDWLGGGFSEYLKSKGEKSLDVLLGAKRNKGQTPVFKEARAISIENTIMIEIGFLTLTDISIEDAAAMVKGRLESQNLKCPTAETLAERCIKRGWSRVFKIIKAELSEIPDDAKRAVIRLYPDYTIPSKWKAAPLV